MHSVQVAALVPDLLGEAPQWHPAEARLYWVDSFAPAIRRLDPGTGVVESFALPHRLTRLETGSPLRFGPGSPLRNAFHQ